MKMHILAAAFLTALAARGASASSEGGDTWSALEPVQRSTLVLQAPPHAAPTASGLDARWDGSEGGDTWSHLQALRQAGSGQASSEDRAASSDTGTASPTAASEGGDTWSRLQPQKQGGPAQTAGLAAKPML